MKHVFLIVEGQSEEAFYKHVLSEYFRTTHFFAVTTMPNKKNKTSREYKGGTVTYDLCIRNIRRFLNSATHCDKFFLILDYYGLHASFLDNYQGGNYSRKKVDYIINRIEKEINHQKFSVFLQVHEFEAFLFSEPKAIASHYRQEEKTLLLELILTSFSGNPEDINDSKATSPSHRLIDLFPEYAYGKTTDGVLIAQKIGVDRIAARCPSFQRFLDQLR